jgi:hypothetical protein
VPALPKRQSARARDVPPVIAIVRSSSASSWAMIRHDIKRIRTDRWLAGTLPRCVASRSSSATGNRNSEFGLATTLKPVIRNRLAPNRTASRLRVNRDLIAKTLGITLPRSMPFRNPSVTSRFPACLRRLRRQRERSGRQIVPPTALARPRKRVCHSY